LQDCLHCKNIIRQTAVGSCFCVLGYHDSQQLSKAKVLSTNAALHLLNPTNHWRSLGCLFTRVFCKLFKIRQIFRLYILSGSLSIYVLPSLIFDLDVSQPRAQLLFIYVYTSLEGELNYCVCWFRRDM
jgi:hypothetical protein